MPIPQVQLKVVSVIQTLVVGFSLHRCGVRENKGVKNELVKSSMRIQSFNFIRQYYDLFFS